MLPNDAATQSVHILFVENRSSDASRIQSFLGSLHDNSTARRLCFDLACVRSIESARDRLRGEHSFDVILFDVGQTDITSASKIVQLHSAAAHLPLIVLADDDDYEQSDGLIRQGIQDWIPKGELSRSTLVRAISHALARKQHGFDLCHQLQRLRAVQTKTQRQLEKLRTHAKQLETTNRELDDFVYVVSHDLKEPLRGIRAYCELLAEDYEEQLDTAGVDRLSSIMRMCARLEAQIADLLTFYRVGRIKTPAVRVDLTEIVDGQIAALRNFLDHHNGTVRIRGPLPTVEGHPVLLGMVFSNLISNGLKYNRTKRPTVEIGTSGSHPETVYVRDNGIGIDNKHHGAIFDLFRRLHGHGEFEGTGAGLTIVRKIVRSYGGDISVESEIDRGTTFLFTLPTATIDTPRPPHWINLKTGNTPHGSSGQLTLDRS